MSAPRIEFSQNWNGKLLLDHFSTVRLHNEQKYFVGNHLEVYLKNVYMGEVKIEAARPFPFNQIRDILSYIDCGKPAHYLAEVMNKMYAAKNQSLPGDTLLHHVVLGWSKRNMDAHSNLASDWWTSIREKATV